MARILVIQAEEALARVVERLVAGRHTVTVVTGNGPIPESVRRADFDAIVCDVPDPQAVYDEWAAVDVRRACSILFVVSWATAEVVARLPNALLVKPFPLSELHDAIESIVGGTL